MVPPVRTAGPVATALSVIAVLSYIFVNNRTARLRRNSMKHRGGILDAIGNTPLIRINSLSDAIGCEILRKAEFLSPAGSVKDRVAVKILEEALESGELSPGGVVTEGSAGSTAISLAIVAPAYGCKCHVVVPDDAAMEKSQILEGLGATVERVRPVSITHREHYVNIAALEAKGLASEHQSSRQTSKQINQVENGVLIQGKQSLTILVDSEGGGFFADQFENLANFRAHYEGTEPEIWEQVGGHLDAFVAAAGTGGTVAGVPRFLKIRKFDPSSQTKIRAPKITIPALNRRRNHLLNVQQLDWSSSGVEDCEKGCGMRRHCSQSLLGTYEQDPKMFAFEM